MIHRDPVPGRPGWEFGLPVKEGTARQRIPVVHSETRASMWVWGEDRQAWVSEAQRAIDGVYEQRWSQYAELIEAGDYHGPNVRLL